MLDDLSTIPVQSPSPETFSEEEMDSFIRLEGGSSYHPLEYDSPVDLLLTHLDEFAKGGKSIYPWQQEVLDDISRPGFTPENPCLQGVVACNGSGKDAVVIAGFAVWLLTCKVRSRVIITTSSDRQLVGQTEPYIRRLCEKLNADFGSDYIRIRKKHIICNLTGSEILMFVTDDPGKAEGYHPFPDSPERTEAIIVNESKTVAQDIFNALEKCTYSHLLLISSPGAPAGKFHDEYQTAIKYPFPREVNRFHFRRVSYKDCPHISEAKYQRACRQYGVDSAFVQNTFLAGFATLEIGVVIPSDLITRASFPPADFKPIQFEGGRLRAGLDFALGGDEATGYIIDGNVILDSFSSSETNSFRLAALYVAWLNKYKSRLSPSDIFGDDGGLGKGLIDHLVNAGWNINRIHNQSRAADTTRYGNKGAEMYGNIKRLMEHGLLFIDPKYVDLRNQLGSRFNRNDGSNKLMLESKTEARKRNHGSPDHADAYVLAHHGLTPENFGLRIDLPTEIEPSGRIIGSEGLEEFIRNVAYGKTPRFQEDNKEAKHSGYSSDIILRPTNRSKPSYFKISSN